MDIYYGPFKIVSVTNIKSKTYLNSPRVEIETETGEKIELPESVFDRLKSDKPITDLSEFRDVRVAFALESIQVLLAENEYTKDDIEYIISRIPQIFTAALNTAIENKFNKPIHMINLNDIEKAIVGDK